MKYCQKDQESNQIRTKRLTASQNHAKTVAFPVILRATEFAKFKENMNAELYCEILAKYLLLFEAHKYNYFFKLYQNNDPKHTSSLCTSYLTENDVFWFLFIS
ncbi:hypothetical protein BpHYR1_022127 [Brachionus plicatilis]|uniref:Uncharacterized protein n=1 Tax=Brachionus plicatilis TaxID=10195 RepID=A0A3M7SEV4_BRAPC|nr:hypothetical protein BpHYR1_022127 [Brachionus plicatilis]